MKKILSVFALATTFICNTCSAQEQKWLNKPDIKSNITYNDPAGTVPVYTVTRYLKLKEATITATNDTYKISYVTSTNGVATIFVKDDEYKTFEKVMHAFRTDTIRTQTWEFSFFQEVTNGIPDKYWKVGFGVYQDYSYNK